MRPGYNLDYYLDYDIRDVDSASDTEQLWQMKRMLRLSCPQKPATMSGKTWDTRWSKRCLLDYVMLRGY